MRVIFNILVFFIVAGLVLGASAPDPITTLPPAIAAVLTPQSKVKSVDQYSSSQTADDKPLTLYVVHTDGGRANLFLLDSNSRVIWQRMNKPEPIIVGVIGWDLPPVFGYSYWGAASANFTAYKLLMWDGQKPRIVFDGFSGDAGDTPVFKDLLGDGTREMIFYNSGGADYRPPYILVWNGSRFCLENRGRKFPAFWDELIRGEMAKLKAWQYSRAHAKAPLVYCAWLESYFCARGGTKEIPDFFKLAGEKLDLLARSTRNDYIQERVKDEKGRVRATLRGPISDLVQDFQIENTNWPANAAELPSFLKKTGLVFDLGLYPNLSVGEDAWKNCHISYDDPRDPSGKKVDFSVGPDVTDMPGKNFANFENEFKGYMIRDLTSLIQNFQTKNGRWPKDSGELRSGPDQFHRWNDCLDLNWAATPEGDLACQFTFSPEDLPVEAVTFLVKPNTAH